MTQRQINNTHATVFSELDAEVEENGQYVRSRIKELLEDPGSRNISLWSAEGIDSSMFEITFSDLEHASGGIHDLAYTIQVAGLWGACRLQALVEVFSKGILKNIDSQSKRLREVADKSDREELRLAAIEGTTKEEFRAAKKIKNGTKEKTKINAK